MSGVLKLGSLLSSVLLVATGLLLGTPVASPPADAASVPDPRPNIILITTDDQALTDLEWMPATQALIGDAGVTFGQAVAPHPLCCPARAQILTGQYAQNNGVRSNAGPHGGYDALIDPANHVGAWLRDSGYHSGVIGKFLNGYRTSHGILPGWDHWAPSVAGVYNAYRYTMNVMGRLEMHEGGLHTNDYVAQSTAALVREWAPQDKPFFLWSSYVAPHGQCVEGKVWDVCDAPPTPADRHRGAFKGVRNPAFKKPSFNERDVSDKPSVISERRFMGKPRMQRLFKRRIQSLASVDEGVAATVAALAETGELDNTYLIFTSDNGYLLGEHRFTGKVLGYQESLRVPFLVRGPGIPANQSRSQQVALIDIAPTIAEIAGVAPGRTVDGQSFLPAAVSRTPLTRTLLVQAGPYRNRGDSEWSFRGVSDSRYTYMRWNVDGFRELYDRRLDPFELENAALSRRYRDVRKALEARLRALQSCAGDSCRVDFGRLPKPRPLPKGGSGTRR